MLLRLLCLVLYVAGFIALRAYLRKRPPLYKGKVVSPHMHLLYALGTMWGALLWFVPGLIWINILPVPVNFVIRLSFFIPLGIFMTFLLAICVFPVTSTTFKDVIALLRKLAVPLMVTFVALFIVLQTFLALSYYAFNPLHFLLFLVFIALPPVMGLLVIGVCAADLIPLDDAQENRWLSAMKLFVGFFTTFPKSTWVIEDGEAKTHIEGHAFRGFGPGWLMTEPENVVVLQGGTDIKRVVGPGVVLTEPSESPYQVVDLRNQARSAKIDAVTRDGIAVKLPISSQFRINRGYKTINIESLKNHEPWPYRNKSDIFRTVFAEEVDPAGKTPLEAHQARSWGDLPIETAKQRLKQVVPLFGFDQLYTVDQNTKTLTRAVLGKTVRETVEETVELLGIEVLGGGVGDVVKPNSEAVAKQQVAVWQARWLEKTMAWKTDMQVKRYQALSNAHSEARADLLSGLLKETQQSFQDADNGSDLIAYHLLENLLLMAQNAQVKERLPASAMPTLLQLRQLTQEEQK